MSFLLVAVSIFLLFLSTALFLSEGHGYAAFLSFMTMLLLIIWLGAAISLPGKLDYQYKVKVHNIDMISCCVVKGTIINLNDQLKRSFNEGDEVNVKFYKSGPYYQIYFTETYDLEIVDAKNPTASNTGQ